VTLVFLPAADIASYISEGKPRAFHCGRSLPSFCLL
jgi:hypothetical protein